MGRIIKYVTGIFFVCIIWIPPAVLVADASPTTAPSISNHEGNLAGFTGVSQSGLPLTIPLGQGGIWSDVDVSSLRGQEAERLIFPDECRLVAANIDVLDNLLAQAPMENTKSSRSTIVVLPLPLPEGSNGRFRIEKSPIMEPALAARFPEIKTYRGVGLDDPTATARLDRTPAGFHGMILSSSDTIYIDPYSQGDIVHYMSYYRSDYRNYWGKSFNEDIEGSEELEPQEPPAPARSGPTLRTYRLAVAAQGEYTQFHDDGDAVADALAAINTTINRVNGIYERDVSIRLNLVANNDQIIYTNPATDPYTNNDSSGTTVTENQTNLDNVIGSANYDIGHVFNTGGGGLGEFAGPCNNANKAQGATGSNSPVGDPFDVNFVAHEIGHQFNARHTWNAVGAGSCTSGGRDTPYEPGSGSTIMAYAGICDTQDLQLNSDDHFHAISVDYIIDYAANGTGNTCGTQTATGNTWPTVDAGSNYTIPKQTPFTLNGSGNDSEGDSLTFNWEEFDTGVEWTNASVLPNTDADGNARPIFRSYSPTTSTSRTFPALSSILDGSNSNDGESLPNIDRTMQFRLTVRDGRGGVNHDDMTVSVEDAAGPFAVTSPNTAVTWDGNSQQSVTWDVANTNVAPVNCTNVNILLSTDGGNTFPTTVVSNTPNDGAELVTIPNSATTTARVKVECVSNIFFDISNIDFTITTPGTIYLPLITKDWFILPDLVIESVVVNSNAVMVTIRNVGTVSASDAFWVDVYFDPSVVPSLNQPWDTIASHGAVWGVTDPIPAGGSITLTTDGTYYFPDLSSQPPFPVGVPVYVLVDSINYDTTHGNVQESDEDNNLFGPVTSTAGVASEPSSKATQDTPSRDRLPER